MEGNKTYSAQRCINFDLESLIPTLKSCLDLHLCSKIPYIITRFAVTVCPLIMETNFSVNNCLSCLNLLVVGNNSLRLLNSPKFLVKHECGMCETKADAFIFGQTIKNSCPFYISSYDLQVHILCAFKFCHIFIANIS